MKLAYQSQIAYQAKIELQKRRHTVLHPAPGTWRNSILNWNTLAESSQKPSCKNINVSFNLRIAVYT